MRRDKTKFNIYTKLVLNTKRYSKIIDPKVLDVKSVLKTSRSDKQIDTSNIINKSSASESEPPPYKILVNQIKLPKISFNLSPTYRESSNLFTTSHPCLENFYEESSKKAEAVISSLSSIQKSFSSPKIPIEPPVFKTINTFAAYSQDIFSAIKLDKMSHAIKLLKKTPSLVNARDSVGKTPLHWAVIRNNISLVQLLLGSGADRNAEDYCKRTVKHFINPTNFEMLEIIDNF